MKPYISLSEYKCLTLPSSTHKRAVKSLLDKGLVILKSQSIVRLGLTNYRMMYYYETTKLGREVLEEIRETEWEKSRWK